MPFPFLPFVWSWELTSTTSTFPPLQVILNQILKQQERLEKQLLAISAKIDWRPERLSRPLVPYADKLSGFRISDWSCICRCFASWWALLQFKLLYVEPLKRPLLRTAPFAHRPQVELKRMKINSLRVPYTVKLWVTPRLHSSLSRLRHHLNRTCKGKKKEFSKCTLNTETDFFSDTKKIDEID